MFTEYAIRWQNLKKQQRLTIENCYMAYKCHISKEIRVDYGHLLTFVHPLDIICTWIGIFGEQITAVFRGGSS